METLRAKYAKVFKLLRLADGNANADERQAAMRQAQKLISQLEMAVAKLESEPKGENECLT